MTNKRNVAVGTLLVAAAGYVAGLLTAPKSGRETRKDIRNAALKAKSEGERKLKTAHSELNVLLTEASLMASKSRTKASEELSKAREKAEAIRDKTRVLLSAIHEGEAEDEDLNIALQDVKAAIKHLKQYVSKPEAKKE
jgi:gas vesicle protein